MQETFKVIEREISTRKIEIKSKPKFSLDAFGNQQESFLCINSYMRANDYWKHLCQIIGRTKEAIKAQHDLCLDPFSALDLLEEHHLYLCELCKIYLPENKELILDGIDLARLIPRRYASDYSEIIEKKLLHFLEIQKIAINGLKEFIKRKIKSTERHIELFGGKDPDLIPKPVKFKQTETLRPLDKYQESDVKLFWTKTDADLVELITALFEANALKSNNGRVTKKQLHGVLESLFNHPMKDVRSKLYKIKCRKGKQDLFLHELKLAFLDGISRIETQKHGDSDNL
jgi:RteC protein